MKLAPKSCLLAAASLGALVVAGCGGESDAHDLGQVKGVVKLDGKPVEGVSVIFKSETISKQAVGITDENGQYELSYGKNTKGAPLGMCRVEFMRVMRPDKGVLKDDIPSAYNQDSKEQRDVKPGKQEFNFDLSSRRVRPKRNLKAAGPVKPGRPLIGDSEPGRTRVRLAGTQVGGSMRTGAAILQAAPAGHFGGSPKVGRCRLRSARGAIRRSVRTAPGYLVLG